MSDEETKAPQGDDTGPEPEVDEAAEKAKAEAAAKARAEAAAAAKAAKEAAEAAKPPWQRDPKIPEWQEADDSAVAGALREAHGDAIAWARTLAGDLVVMVARESICDVARTLHDEHGFTMLIDICGAHYPDREDEPEFEVIYQLLNLDTVERVRLRVGTEADTPVPTVVPVWRGANWPEREIWDMYGVSFEGHPDMTRILMWEGFNGFPMRKDFPIEGIDTGSAIYPEYYEETAGPVAGTGTGWKPPEEPEDEEAAPGADDQG